MAELELLRPPPDRLTQDLVAEADAEDRDLPQERPDRLDDIGERRRIAGAVGRAGRPGLCFRISSAVVSGGRTVTFTPRSLRCRRMLWLRRRNPEHNNMQPIPLARHCRGPQSPWVLVPGRIPYRV